MLAEVWTCHLPEAGEHLSSLVELLSPDEKERLAACQNCAASERFLAGRGLLRLLLGERLGCRPQEVRFAYSASGKPILRPGDGEQTIGFNLSHSGALLAIAVAGVPGMEVGVDVEWRGARRACERVVARFGTAAERAAFLSVPEGERREAFFRWWTRKEAAAKGAGVPLARALGRLEAPFGANSVSELAVPGAGLWRVCTWEIAAGYTASLAVPREGAREAGLLPRSERHPRLPLRLASVLVPRSHETAAQE